jgi:hypothetical protein
MQVHNNAEYNTTVSEALLFPGDVCMTGGHMYLLNRLLKNRTIAVLFRVSMIILSLILAAAFTLSILYSKVLEEDFYESPRGGEESENYTRNILVLLYQAPDNFLSRFVEGIEKSGEISSSCENLVMRDLHSSFRPEFLNRLDEIILFKPLTKENINGIIDLLLVDLNKRLADRDIKISVTETAKDFVIESAYDPAYGARPIKRFLQKNVETLSARLILSDQVHTGDTILIDVENNEFVTKVK